VIYDASGWILTNRHVVAGSTSLIVELKDGREFAGRVYGIDTLTDLAIVKVDASGLPTARVGASDGLKVGQLVVAIGSPLGTYSFSVTTGNVVGINTAVATDSNGIGFAIPIDIARPIMEQAVRGEELKRPYIGVRFQTIDRQLKEEANLPVDSGAYVSSGGGTEDPITADSPAEKAGLRDGDIILRVEGITLDREHPLDAVLVRFSPGDQVTLDVLRNGTSLQVKVILGTRPGDL
jgi:S1-C subfamily serine protease